MRKACSRRTLHGPYEVSPPSHLAQARSVLFVVNGDGNKIGFHGYQNHS